MKRMIVALVMASVVVVVGFAQVKAPTLREEVKQKGAVWRTSYSEDLFLAKFEQLLPRTDLIIRGRIVDERTRLSADEHSVRTDYTIEVLEIFYAPKNLAAVGDRLVVTKGGGNVLVGGKPIRVDTPLFPPIPWVAPHVFFITRWTGEGADGQYYFAGAELGVLPVEGGKIVCRPPSKAHHPVTKDFCNKTEAEFRELLKEKIAAAQAGRTP